MSSRKSQIPRSGIPRPGSSVAGDTAPPSGGTPLRRTSLPQLEEPSSTETPEKHATRSTTGSVPETPAPEAATDKKSPLTRENLEQHNKSLRQRNPSRKWPPDMTGIPLHECAEPVVKVPNYAKLLETIEEEITGIDLNNSQIRSMIRAAQKRKPFELTSFAQELHAQRMYRRQSIIRAQRISVTKAHNLSEQQMDLF